MHFQDFTTVMGEKKKWEENLNGNTKTDTLCRYKHQGGAVFKLRITKKYVQKIIRFLGNKDTQPKHSWWYATVRKVSTSNIYIYIKKKNYISIYHKSLCFAPCPWYYLGSQTGMSFIKLNSVTNFVWDIFLNKACMIQA